MGGPFRNAVRLGMGHKLQVTNVNSPHGCFLLYFDFFVVL